MSRTTMEHGRSKRWLRDTLALGVGAALVSAIAGCSAASHHTAESPVKNLQISAVNRHYIDTQITDTLGVTIKAYEKGARANCEKEPTLCIQAPQTQAGGISLSAYNNSSDIQISKNFNFTTISAADGVVLTANVIASDSGQDIADTTITEVNTHWAKPVPRTIADVQQFVTDTNTHVSLLKYLTSDDTGYERTYATVSILPNTVTGLPDSESSLQAFNDKLTQLETDFEDLS